MSIDGLHEYVTQWHDAWSILGAVATTVAVIIALWSITHERQARRAAEMRAQVAERQREVQRVADETRRIGEDSRNRWHRRRDQGLRVIGWIEWQPDPTSFVSAGGALQERRFGRVVNLSDAPVYDMSFQVVNAERDQTLTLAERTVLVAGEELSVALPQTHQDPGERMTAFVLFRDLQGARWRRLENGELAELDHSGQPIHDPVPV
ncbi:hypothetical protein [Cellulomonas sp. KRMCY2]|uniref:hypothetical protein n=1 Tax=Cellulomonas sp. KRMCY2 TaxID=1304865 RepID=UPI00045E8150|nr:hypothetical protein [Cellulomonas sp. KRMCY2]